MRRPCGETQRRDAVRLAVARTSAHARRYQVQVRSTFVRVPRARSAVMAT
jgi:hypothetical protein